MCRKLKISSLLWSIFIPICSNVFTVQANIGRPCKLKDTKAIGECVLLSDCPAAIRALKEYNIRPQSCNMGFVGKDEIICCSRRYADLKCREYSEYAYQWEDSMVLMPGQPRIRKPVTCSYASKIMIGGGVEAEPKEFPHMVAIGYRHEKDNTNPIEWRCGGTLISENFVLTAGHCVQVDKNHPLPKVVRLADHNLASAEDDFDVQQILIESYMCHPGYHPPERYNDICLLKLAKSVEFNDYTRPACLFTNPDIRSQRVLVTGWGIANNSTLEKSDVLKKATLNLVDAKNCNKTYLVRVDRRFRGGVKEEQHFCAGNADDGSNSTCGGDSGGPVQIYNKDHDCMYDVVGVTSFAIGCETQKPGVYVRIHNYLDWIEALVWLDISWPNQTTFTVTHDKVDIMENETDKGREEREREKENEENETEKEGHDEKWDSEEFDQKKEELDVRTRIEKDVDSFDEIKHNEL